MREIDNCRKELRNLLSEDQNARMDEWCTTSVEAVFSSIKERQIRKFQNLLQESKRKEGVIT